jgi:hypothetical protein
MESIFQFLGFFNDKIYQMNHDYEQYDHDNCIANF